MRSDSSRGRRDSYVETFDNGPGGWCVQAAIDRDLEPEIRDGAFISRGPWWIDPNHAPPGAGYLHLVAYLHTHENYVQPAERPHHFVEGGYSRDLTNARVTVRVRGQLEPRGAKLTVLVQASIKGTFLLGNWILTGQEIPVGPDWAEHTITLAPDPSQWVCLGSRHDRQGTYGWGDIVPALRDVDVDIIFVLFPLEVAATTPVDDIHRRIPHRDFEADLSRLPAGVIELDTIQIDYPD